MSTPAARGGLATNVVTAALPLVGSFLVSILLAPYLGDAGFGVYSLVMSAATLLLVVAKFGLHSATSRLVSENDEAPGPWIRAGLALRLPLTLGTALVAVALSPWIARGLTGTDETTLAFALAGAVIVGASLFEFAGEVQVGLRAFRPQMWLRVVALALRLAALGLVRWFGVGVEWFLAGHALSQALPSAAVLGRLVHATRAQTAAGVRTLRRTWDLALPLAFSSASFLIYAHTDRLMLGAFDTEAVVGQFSVARNVIDAAMFPVVALTWSLRPAFVRALRPGADEPVGEVLAEGLRLSVVYVCCGAALMAALGPELLRGLYGVEFSEAGRLLVWMVPLLALRGLGTAIFPLLVAADAQRAYARLMGWTAGVNVAANLVLIPTFGAIGAIGSTFVALLLLTVGGFHEVRRAVGPLPWSRRAGSHVRAVVSSGLVAAALLVWDPQGRGLAVTIVAALLGVVVLALVNLGRPSMPFRGGRGA
jgi:O-antigen/teichoic acid export membrane protein